MDDAISKYISENIDIYDTLLSLLNFIWKILKLNIIFYILFMM